MGSSLFYTFEEASSRLGCSKRTIHNHIKRGYLRKSVQAGKVVLYREDVETLANESGVDLPIFNRKNFYMLMNRVQKLEQDMNLCRRILDIRDNPLRPSKQEATQLRMAATAALAANYWTDKEIDNWCELFERFDEVTLTILRDELLLNHPYEVFFRLCLAQMKEVSNRPEFGNSLPLQMLHKRLDEGRKRMRDALLLWAKLDGAPVSDAIVTKLETEKTTLFKKLSPTKGN